MAKNNNCPERLWKYRPWDKHTHALIVHGDVYFSKLNELNDPFECRWREELPTEPNERELYVKEICAMTYPQDTIPERRIHYRDLLNELRGHLEGRRDGIGPTLAEMKHGVFCAAEDYNNILMWSHYATNHSGVCLSIRTQSFGLKRFLPVCYSEKVPLISVWEYVRRNANLFCRLYCTKSVAWSYEKEWRTVHPPGLHRVPRCVDRIIIGALATAETRIAVREAVEIAGHKIQVLEAKLSNTHYALDIGPTDTSTENASL